MTYHRHLAGFRRSRASWLALSVLAAGVVVVVAALPATAGASPARAATAPVTHPPTPPTGLVLAPAGVGQLLATWQPPSTDNGAPITAYLLEVYGANHAYVGRVVASPGQTSEILTGLRPGVSYQFFVNAQNSVGYSHAPVPSNLAAVDVPAGTSRPGAPIGPLVSPVAHAGLRISWQAGAANAAPVRYYRVSVATANRDTVRDVTLPASARSTIVRGLHAGLTYTVRVAATNRYGVGISTDPAKAEALAVVRGSGVGLYSFGQLQTQADWTQVMNQGWAGLLDTEALGAKTAPYTALVGNPDAGVQAALDATPSYNGFWVSFWTVDAPDPATDPTLTDFSEYGRLAGAYAAQHTAGLPGTRRPDYLAVDYEGYFAPQNQAQYIAETDGWAAGIHSILPTMQVLYYTAGQNAFLNNGLGVIDSAGYQPAVTPIIGNAPQVPDDGDVVGYQGLFAACTDGSAQASVATVAGWGPDRPISQVEFDTAQDECGPGIATPAIAARPAAGTATPATAPACAATSVGYTGTQAADGMNGVAVFSVRNDSSQSCSVTGSPTVTMRTTGGAAISSPLRAGATTEVPRAPSSATTIGPGQQAFFTIAFTRDPDGAADRATAATVTMPGEHGGSQLSLQTAGPVALSPEAGTVLTVSPLSQGPLG